MAIRTYINNYFKCNWIKCSTKRHRLGGMDRKTIPIYAVYKKPTSDLKTHVD